MGVRSLLNRYQEVFVDYPGFPAEVEQYHFLKGSISGALRHLADSASLAPVTTQPLPAAHPATVSRVDGVAENGLGHFHAPAE
jgi:hypothetical protein